MSRFVKTTFFCASCGRVRQEANHWFVVYARPTEGGMEIGGIPAIYCVTRFNGDRTRLADYEFPVCGEECLTKVTTKVIAGVSIA